MAALRKISIPAEHLSMLLALLPKGVRPVTTLDAAEGMFTFVLLIGGLEEPTPVSNADIPLAQIKILDQPGKRVIEIVDASSIIRAANGLVY